MGCRADTTYYSFKYFYAMNPITTEARVMLKAQSDETVQKGAKAYFKGEFKNYGVKVPHVRAIAKEVLSKLKGTDKETVFDICEELWKSGYFEESVIACELAYAQRKQFEERDIHLFEKWISCYVNNWASCDTFCNHTVGTFITAYPEYLNTLKKWIKSENRWMRRAAAVTLIVPARKGKFLNDILEIATLLLQDDDDMVQKGYGWMLKVASQAHLQPVFTFIMKHKHEMPRTALRYAIEKMPQELKVQAMAKTSARQPRKADV
jgi:3-methyladenine DNA glycosylase AlkD